MQKQRFSLSFVLQFLVWFVMGHAFWPTLSAAAPSVSTPTTSVESISVGQPTAVLVQVNILTSPGDPALIATSINLLRLDAAGKSTILGVMHDDGLNGDAVAGDNTFSLQVNFTEQAQGTIRLQASAAFKGVLKRTLSAVKEIAVVPRGGGSADTDDDKDGFSENQGDCNDADPTIKPGAPERCNGKDDDCDSQIDEDFAFIALVCTVGVGACERSGSYVCSPDGIGVVCNAIPGAPTAEVCNGIDDDCDGQTDEGTGTEQTCGVGACQRTVTTCEGQAPRECVPGQPGSEICGNGIDEDCSGADLSCTPQPSVAISITGPDNGKKTALSQVAVSGTIGTGVVEVTCNGQVAGLNNSGFGLTLALNEGKNTIFCAAKDASGNTGADTVVVYRDTTKPNVQIETPRNGAVLTALQVDVAGMVNDLAAETAITNVKLSVKVNGVPAMVMQRSFVVQNLLLHRGKNIIQVEAEDEVGNLGRTQIEVDVQDQAGQRIVPISGSGQSAEVGTQLPQPLVVGLIGANGAFVPGQPVTFKVSRGTGQLSAGSETGSTVTVITDDNGLASVNFTLGDRAGAGNHRVTATATGFVGTVEFCAAATPASATVLTAVMGSGQPGIVNQHLPQPFVVLVNDAGGNPVQGVTVSFDVEQGGGHFDEGTSVTRITDVNGQAALTLTLGPDEGINNNVATATFTGYAGVKPTFIASGVIPNPTGDTSVSGIALGPDGSPLAGVVTHIDGTSLSAVTDDQGQFRIVGVPVGHVRLLIDSRVSTGPNGEQHWPPLYYELMTIAGRDNTIGMPIFLVPLDTANSAVVDGSQDVTLTMKDVPGTELTVYANSVICPNGDRQCRVSFTQVSAERMAMPAPLGSVAMLAWTVQPAGTRFDPPAKICIPNMDMPPGHQIEMFYFDKDIGDWVANGTATVTEDGSQLCSDPGYGVVKGAWNCCVAPAPADKTCMPYCPPSRIDECSTITFTLNMIDPILCLYTCDPQTQNKPPGEPCTDDTNKCTRDVCDGFGSCTHPRIPELSGPDKDTFCKNNPAVCAIAETCGGAALQFTSTVFGGNPYIAKNSADAARHAFWMCCISSKLPAGFVLAEAYGRAYEVKGYDGTQTCAQGCDCTLMDLFNNRVGAALGQVPLIDCATSVLTTLATGALITQCK